MTIQTTIHELTRMLNEIRQYRESYNDYYREMMQHLNDMCLRTLLEPKFQRKIPLEQLSNLIKLVRHTKKMMI